MANRLILCDCSGSQSLDAGAIETHSGLACSRVHSALCTREMPNLAKALSQDAPVMVGCAQESARFEALAEELGTPAPLCVDLRDRAGWGEGDATPKIAALLAEAQLPAPRIRSMDVVSHGQCLVIGAGATVFEAAALLSETLAVTVLQTDDSDAPMARDFEVIRGHVASLTGSLGAFSLRIDAFQQIEPGGRGGFGFSIPRDGAKTVCDVIVDLTGDTALVSAPHKRDGYFRADPRSPRMVANMLAEAATAVGTFEKPVYLAVNEALCAHSRAGQTGCNRCAPACPTGALTPDGDHISVDPMLCAGCGACAALCPSGAITYDAPAPDTTLRRIETMARSYREAGGSAAHLLVHDDHGAEMIALSARFGRGLPAHVVPMQVNSLPTMGHAQMLAALATGFDAVSVILSPTSDRDVMEREVALAKAMATEDATARLTLLDVNDPDQLGEALYAAQVPALNVLPILPMGSNRQVARMAAKALNTDTAPRPLPEGAPYGAVAVNTDSCTLCLSCVSLCPSGALIDNPDKPQLSFQEDACLQCGICTRACPENAIALVPRFNPADTALTEVVQNEEEPYCCIQCGAEFGVKSTVERIYNTLAGKHPMFATSDAGRLIQMCDSCRVDAQYHAENSPLSGGLRAAPITTDDYPSKRRDH